MKRMTLMYGPAVRSKKISTIRWWRSCINVSDLLIGASRSGPSWISARVRAHYRTGLGWAIWVTRVRMRREDRTSISSDPLADLGGQ
jgi:hypothetical protein